MTASSHDPITLAVVLNRLNSIATEMTVTLENSAFSPVLALCRDYSCCIYDSHGRQVAMVDAIPIHTNSLHLAIEEIVTRFHGDLAPGDVIMCNDPYSAANTHVGDLLTACPVFHGGRHMFWAVTRGHQLDVGAPIPTSVNFAATNVWQEGLTIPPVKLCAAGELRRDIVEFYLANMRWRDVVEGDLMAQLGSIWTASSRLQELCDAYGADEIAAFVDEAIAYAARRTAANIRAMPNGEYRGSTWLDSDGEREDVPIECTVTIRDEEVEVNFAGSAPQSRLASNASVACLQAGGGLPIMMCIDPDIPHNEGCLRSVTVHAPEGTICNARYPAATALATTQPTDRMQHAVYKALAEAIPEQVPAGSSHIAHMAMLSGTSRDGHHWGHLLLNGGGGSGAANGADGWPLISTLAAWGGLKTASVEHTELLYPIRIDEWELEPGSMGLGEYIGGAGARCRITPVEAPIEIIYNSDGLRNPPYGVAGGTPGAGGGAYVQIGQTGRREFLRAEVCREVAPGDAWVGVSTGGGGYGDPLNRPVERVRRDVRDGLYAVTHARAFYGVVLTGDRDPVVDEAATAAKRHELAAVRDAFPVVVPDFPGYSTWLAETMRAGDVRA